MAEFGAKIKLHVDTSGASAFASEIQQMVNSVSDRITLKLKHVDVKFSSSEIQSAIGKIQNQLTNGLKDVKLSVGDISVDQRATSRLKSQMAVFDDVQKKLSSVYRGAISGKSMITDVGQLDNITKRYMAWVETIDKLRTAQTSLSGDRAAKLALEGINIQQSIQGLQQQEKLIESTAKTQERHLTRALNLYKSINAYTKANPKVMNEQFFGSQINSILGTLSSGQDIDDDAYNNAVRQMAVIKNNAREMGIEGQRAGTLIAQAYAKFGGWRMVTGSMQYVVRGFKEMCRSVIEIDTAMTELKKVTDLTDSAYNNFFDRSITRAKDMGATVTDTITATADFARLGYGLNEAEDLADAALIYKNVGDGITDVSSASESIISTMKAFGIEAADSMSIVDKFNEVGNNFAISSKGIGDALQRSASALAAAGNTIDESIGMAVGMNAVIQDPEKVGTVLKTSSMYLRAAKTDAEAAGEATDGMANSVSELRSELLTLTKGKVDIMADDTTFKSTVQIYRELAAVWEDLADIDAANILELIGGKRNATAIASLLTNFDQVEQAITSAGGSEGSALKENETYLDSLKGKLSELKASFEEFSAAIVGSSLLGGIIGIGDGILSFVTILEKLNILLPAVTIGISAFMAKRRAMNFQADTRMVNGILGAIGDPKSIGSIANISDVTKLQMGLLTQKQSEMMLSRVVAMGLPTNLQDDIAQLLGYEVALDSTTNALERYTRAKMRNEAAEDIADADGNGNVGFPKGKFGGLLGGFGKIATGLSIAATVYSVIKGAYDLYNSHIDGIRQRAADLRTEWEQYSKSYTENIDKIEDYKVEFPKLAAGVDEFGNNVSLTADQFERYRAIVDDIAASSPELIAYYNEQGQAIIRTTGLIENFEKAQKTAYRNELWDKMSGGNFRDLYSDAKLGENSGFFTTGWSDWYDESDGSIIGGLAVQKTLNQWLKKNDITAKEFFSDYGKYHQSFINDIERANEAATNPVPIDTYKKNLDKLYSAFTDYNQANNQFINDMQLVPQLSDEYAALSASAKAALSGLIGSLDVSNISSENMAKSVRNQILELANAFSQLDDLDAESLLAPDTINKAFNDGKITLEAYNGLMNDVTGTYEATIKSLADTLSLQRNQD